jgi:sugar phosphate isomerase/epimerase
VLHELVYFVRPCFVEDFSVTFADVAKAGIKHVVLGSRMGNVDFLDRGLFSMARDILERLELRTVACHGLLSGHFDLNEPEEGFRSHMMKSHCRFMNHMAEIGCRTYVCHPGPAPPGDSRGPLWDRVRKALDELAPKAQSLGVTIALENLPPGHLGDNAEELLRFVDEYACPDVGICYDSGHAHIAEDAVSVLKTLTPLVVTAHLHDNDGTSDHHRIPGLGTIDWPAVVPLLSQCPQLIHVETEAFNTEMWSHKDVYRRYCEILSEPTHAPDALPRAGDV